MARKTKPEADPLLRLLFDHVRPVSGKSAGDGCPGGELLAALTEGKMLDEERRAIEHHLSVCGDCRVLVASVIRDLEDEREPQESLPPILSPRPLTRNRWIVAALLLVGVTVALASAFLVMTIHRRGESSGMGTEDLLVAAARTLAESDPRLFAGFDPSRVRETIGRELKQIPRGAGEPRALYPMGVVLERRPTFRWQAQPDVSQFTVTINRFGDSGEGWRYVATPEPLPSGVAEMPYPESEAELAEGTEYRWNVSTGPLKSVPRAFRIAAKVEREDFERALREIAATVPTGVQALVIAYYALWRGFVGEAEAAARSYHDEHEDNPSARDVLFLTLGMLGSPEAEEFRSGPDNDGGDR